MFEEENNSVLLKQILEEIKSSEKRVTAQILALETNLSQKINTLNNKVVFLEKENSLLKTKLEELQNVSRKNNLIIFGLTSQPQVVTPKYVCEQLENFLQINLNENHLNNCYRLGKSRNSPIKIEFISFLKKSAILKRCSKLKGTQIVISHDLTPEQRNKQKILRRHLNRLRNTTGEKSYIKGDKLHTESGRVITSDDILFYECGLEERKTNSAPPTPTISSQENQDEDTETVPLKVTLEPVLSREKPKTVASETPKQTVKTRAAGGKILANISAVEKRKILRSGSSSSQK